MTDRRESIYQSTYRELRMTLHQHLDAHRQINQRAIDLAKIVLIATSIVVSGLVVVGYPRPITLLVAGIGSLLYAMWCCVQVYRPRPFGLGINADAATEVEEDIEDGKDVPEHYSDLVNSYEEAIRATREMYRDEVEHFRAGLWSSLAALLFLVAATGRVLLPPYGIVYDVPILFIVPAVAIWAKNIHTGK